MTEKSLSRKLGTPQATGLMTFAAQWSQRLLCAALLATAASTAFAEDALKEVSFAALPGGDVEIALALENGTAEGAVFATTDPPRIAIDLPATRNRFDERLLNVATGSTKSVTTVEAAGRTRVVIDLYRPSPYTSRKQGNNIFISIQNGFADSIASSAPTDPAKAVANGPQLELTNLDFRRGKAGEGRLILTFSGDGASADLREEGGGLVVDLANVAVPERLMRKMDVIDFATPVESVDVRDRGNGARMKIGVAGEYEKLAYQAGNQYIVEIARKREEPKKRLATDPPIYSGNRVTFNFQDIPVRSVLQLVADVSDINIVVADSVQGNVTLRLINVPWDQALDIILQAKGLDKRRNGNVIWIAPTAEIALREQALEDARIALEDRAETVVDYIAISYGKAEDMAKLLTTDSLSSAPGGGGGGGGDGGQQQLQKGLLSIRGSVSFDVRTNTLIVTDIPERVAKVRELVAILDRPVRQVLIEARIVIAQEGFRKTLGARFGVSAADEDNDGNLISIGGSLGATDGMIDSGLRNRASGQSSALPVDAPGLFERLNFNLPVSGAGAGSFATTILGADYLLDMEISALENEERGELLSSPKVITADQQEAVIKQGQEIAYQKTEGSGANATTSIEFKEAVLELLVTPRITADGRVFLAIRVKRDNIASFLQTDDGGQIPILDKREVQTGALIDNGQTVVLGGIYEFESNSSLTKVPFLGDIPGVGALFRNKDKSSSKVELLIFVTPKILVDTQQN